MKYINEHFIPLLLGISLILLALSMPGGLIENRDFSQTNPEILSTFHILLVLLVGSSAILMWYTFYQSAVALLLSVLTGFTYVSVFLLDLLAIFPVTSMHLSDSQFFTKTLGLFIGILLVICAGNAFNAIEQPLYIRFSKSMGASTFMFLSLVISSTVIVGFSSYAMYATY